ncbi:MAG: dihydroorotase [Pseudomonadota bacterium]
MLITNAVIFNEGRELIGDLRIKNGRIDKVAKYIAASAEEEVFDADGRWLLPGFIDDQVHFREPGLTHKGDLATESAAAVAGGITSFMEMPNTIPNATTREILAQKYVFAQGRARANFAFYFGGANDNLEEVKRLQPGEACGVKVFMGASTGNMLVDDPKTLEGIFQHAPGLIATHCEDTPTIKANEAAAKEKYGDDIPLAEHPYIRSEAACYKSSLLATTLAKKYNAKLHVLHLTTAKELEFFPAGPLKDKRITAEACVHHLFFDETDYATRGNFIKCNPAIKTVADRVALLAAVRDGRLDVIATDHAPHTLEEKSQPYIKAPSGLPLVQHALLMVLELVKRGEFDLHTAIARTSHGVAERFGVKARGYIREGYWADLVLVDPNAKTTITRDKVLYKCGWSPLEGMTLSHSIAATWVNGELAYASGKVSPEIKGIRLEFN